MTNRVAIVTGASQGIGQAVAVRLARDFGAVVLVARDRAKLELTAEKVRSVGAEALVLDMDLAEQSSAKVVVAKTLAAYGRIDALLNIAGAVPQIDVLEMTDAQWDAGMALKLHATRRLTVEAWQALMATQGSVVMIAGTSATVPRAPQAAVGTINAAIVALAKAFSDRGIVDGVRVNSVLPGAVMTERRRALLERGAALRGITVEEATERFPAEAGITRYGQPDDVAALMAFLVSPAAGWMTGSSLRMDGGEVKAV